MFSSQFWTLSTRAIIPASFARITAWEFSGLPNAFRCEVHLRQSSGRLYLDGELNNLLEALFHN